MRVPEIRFARTPRGAVAFQEWGDPKADVTLVVPLPFGGSTEGSWDHPALLRIWEMYNGICRTVILDHRGLGMSDQVPIDRLGDLDDWVHDEVAVLDELEIERAVFTAEMYAVHAVLRLAVAHPERVERIAISNAELRGALVRGDIDVDTLGRSARAVELAWGTGQVIGRTSRHLSGDASLLARFERLAASPAAAGRMVEVSSRVDSSGVAPLVTVPTLVSYTGEYSWVREADVVELAEAIPGASYVRHETGNFYWGGDDEGFAFVFGQLVRQSERDVAAVVFTDVVNSTGQAARSGDAAWRTTLQSLDGIVELQVAAHGGRVVKQTGDGHLLEFPRPSEALAVTTRLLVSAPTLGVALRAGIHFGEIERRPNGDIGGLAVHIGARIGGLAEGGQILVSRTVVEMSTGSGHAFSSCGHRELRGVPGSWEIFTLDG